MGEAKWEFEPVGPMGGATGNAFANTLQGAGMAPAAELAREAIQNSCDAVADGGPRVRVVFRIENLEGRDRRGFLDELQLERSFSERLNALGVAPDNCLGRAARPLCLVFAEDYDTTGLPGDPHNRHSHLHRLLLSVGDSTKALSGGSGGSYGYGKSALSLNSRIRTIVAYSRFEPDETGATARLMGCAYFDAHEFGGREWTGRAWFGIPRGDNGLVVDPLQDDAAHDFAGRLGFQLRPADEAGTSILIVDSHAQDPIGLVRAIEEWWWPRLVDHALEIEVEASGETYFPQPKQRSDLAPFVDCYTLAVGRAEPAGPHQKADKFNRLTGLGLGAYGLQLIADDQSAELPEEKSGRIALIRSPKMVVQYVDLARPSPAAVGVFVADPEIDDILKLSEPPNHDRWDPDTRRLEIAKPDEETARKVVRQVITRLKDHIRRFQAQATPPKSQDERRLRFLERELASFFRPSLRDGERTDGEAEPIEVRFREGPVARALSSGELETFAKIALRLRPDADEEEVGAIVRVRVPVLKDDRGTEDQPLPVTVESQNTDVPWLSETEPEFRVSLTKDEWIAFTVRTGAYEPAWSTRVNVEIVSGEGA